MTGMHWKITPLGVLAVSLKRELGFVRHTDAKLDQAIDRALTDLVNYMDKNKSEHAFTALVRDDDGMRFVSVQKS